MEIERVAAKDLLSVSYLFVSIFDRSPWNEHWELDWAYERINWLYNSCGFRGYIAIEGDRIIGAIMGYFIPFQGKKGFKIEEFLVQTEHQNLGIGTLLLDKLESSLKQDSYDFVSLLTARNSNAESFYIGRSYRRSPKIVLLNKEL